MKEQIEETKKFIQSKPVVVYMKGTPEFPACGFSARAIQVLKECGVQPQDLASYNILENPEQREVLRAITNWPTIPQVFVKGEFLGGSDILLEMYQAGELQEKLKN